MHAYFLKTERLGFSHWKQEDLSLALSLWKDPEVTRYLWARHFTEKEVEERLQQEIKSQIENKVQYWPLFLLKNDEFIGCCGLKIYEAGAEKSDPRIYQLGTHLLPAYWKNGYFTEGIEAVIRYALEKLKAHNVFVGHHPQNDIACHVLADKLGFHSLPTQFYAPIGLECPTYLLFPDNSFPIKKS